MGIQSFTFERDAQPRFGINTSLLTVEVLFLRLYTLRRFTECVMKDLVCLLDNCQEIIVLNQIELKWFELSLDTVIIHLAKHQSFRVALKLGLSMRLHQVLVRESLNIQRRKFTPGSRSSIILADFVWPLNCMDLLEWVDICSWYCVVWKHPDYH